MIVLWWWSQISIKWVKLTYLSNLGSFRFVQIPHNWNKIKRQRHYCDERDIFICVSAMNMNEYIMSNSVWLYYNGEVRLSIKLGYTDRSFKSFELVMRCNLICQMWDCFDLWSNFIPSLKTQGDLLIRITVQQIQTHL